MERSNSYVLISGATSGIGLEFAKIYATNGYNLILVSRNLELLEKTKEELLKINDVNIIIFAYDLSIIENTYDLYQKIKDSSLEVNVLINNAGFGDAKEFLNADINKLNKMVDLNIKSLMNMCHLFGNDMKERKSGRILNVASVAAYLAGPYMSVYYATKAFVLNFTVGLYHELKPYGVKIHALCPGPTKTKFIDVCESKNKKGFNRVSASPYKVAKIAYKKMKRNKLIINAGLSVKLISFASRITTRKFISKRTEKINGK